jgi:hypothetical protein
VFASTCSDPASTVRQAAAALLRLTSRKAPALALLALATLCRLMDALLDAPPGELGGGGGRRRRMIRRMMLVVVRQ